MLGVGLAILATALIALLTLYLSLPRIAWWLHQRRMNADA